ncbi:unnamed protein product [Cuscuta europaea]|uniref:LNS2/PITP domain-containing protein n=1 Tax=Cuscuta europaea TaxID=41803 RepID=A0A9P0Z8V2_CUSEU|nr:unnamed protein product [Cuscuta europaea]
MNAVGRIGSYITRSVYTVSTPFHPFGGAVDIIVVEQPDGSFKSSPWYVRFGKFQGVLKAKEKLVKICVNGVEMGFHMYLENDGQACFLREVIGDEASCGGGGDDDTTNVLSNNNTRLSVKSKSCDFVGMESISAAKIGMGDGNVVVRAKPHRSGILGYVFGRKATKEGGDKKGSDARNDDKSLEHSAEIASDLLEVKWSTNLDSPKILKDSHNNAPEESSDLKGDSKNDDGDDKSASIGDKSADSSLSSPQCIGDINSNINLMSCTYSHDQENPEAEVSSIVEVESQTIFSISSISSATCKAHSTKDGKRSPCRSPPEANPVFSFESSVTSVSSSEEEDQLLFGDLDDGSVNKEKTNRLHDPEEVVESHVSLYDISSSSNKYDEDNKPFVSYRSSKLTSAVSNADIPVKHDKAQRMAISLPNMWPRHDNQFSSHVSCEILSQHITEDPSICQELNDRLTVPVTDETTFGGNLSLPIDSCGESEVMDLPQPSTDDDNVKTGAGSLTKGTGGISTEEDLIKVTKKIKRAFTPTSEQIASLNLKEGKNEVIFTFSTPMLGEQKVDAQIYLWKWDMRIVISDVDGTITRSDVLGQFMPLVGVDWSQTGVVHLFSAIKENGYQMLFLSARSISQAYITRQFLVNLMQDGKGMPEGPVIISPDGLFPSLFREVVRRAPHEFKIACLEDIKALFPSDRNPFYAGFGNRDTDEISYLRVGIPKGKIFIINPKGEIVVNRHITNTKSYTSLHVLVNGMFPDFSSSEQEDFNSWNFWKLPPT